LGFTHRVITACRKHISIIRKPKKAIPAVIKTTGDYLLFKRYEKGLTQGQVAQVVGVTSMIVKDWEEDVQTPTETEWIALKDLLALTEWPGNS